MALAKQRIKPNKGQSSIKVFQNLHSSTGQESTGFRLSSKEYNDEYESGIRHIKMIVPLVGSLLHSGLFSNPTCVSDEILLKNEVDEENVSEVLGSNRITN